MKDKLFWIALIFAGVYLYFKMGNSNTNTSTSEVQTERTQERESRSDRSLDEPHFGDQNAQLKLPPKKGESRSPSTTRQKDYGTQTKKDLPDLQSQNKQKEISLGEYGSVTLPKKNGSSNNTQSNTAPQRNTNNNRNTSTPTIELNPKTKRGEGRMNNVVNQPLLVLEGTELQISTLENSEIYMDEHSFCAIGGGSNNIIYMMKGAQLMLTGNGNNNTIYYEQGSSVRNGISGTNNQLHELQGLSFK